jgi:agmatine deiminase
VFYHRVPSYEPWCRDHGPIFVKRDGELAIVDWGYNAWGGKYPPYDEDDAVPQRVAELLGLPVFGPGIVMEGGALDVNGEGTLLTTEACLLNLNRNPQLNKPQIEQYLTDYLGVTNILWLGEGIAGDDTDGHVDDLARFVNPTTIVSVVESDPQDDNYRPLQENLKRLRTMRDQDQRPLRIVELPMPGVVEYEGQRLPASYANFYIANGVVLLPTYRDRENDAAALRILQGLFIDRRVVGIDSTNLVWGLGSFHCLTQQQPAA